MNKKILISLGIIAALALYIVFSGRDWSSDIPELGWKDSPDEIRISSQDGSIRLYAKEGKWLINDEAYPADQSAVDNIVDKMKDLEITDLISKQGYLEKYELTPEKRKLVEMKKGGSVFRTVSFGKKGPTGRHTFIAVDDKKDVYLASGVFDGVVNKTVDELRDKTIMKITRDDVSSLSLSRMGRTFVFDKKQVDEPETGGGKETDGKAGKDQKPAKKKTDIWVCRGFEKVAIDRTKIDQILAALDPLKASGFAAPDAKVAGAPVSTVKITAGGKNIDVAIYGKDKDNRHLAKSSESPYVFTMDEWKAKKFFIDSLDGFRKRE